MRACKNQVMAGMVAAGQNSKASLLPHLNSNPGALGLVHGPEFGGPNFKTTREAQVMFAGEGVLERKGREH